MAPKRSLTSRVPASASSSSEEELHMSSKNQKYQNNEAEISHTKPFYVSEPSSELEAVAKKEKKEANSKRDEDPTTMEVSTVQEFVKNSFSFNPSVPQMKDKLKRLKKKSKNNAAKNFISWTDEHENELHNLSLKIWGGSENKDKQISVHPCEHDQRSKLRRLGDLVNEIMLLGNEAKQLIQELNSSL